jgi:REP element-mobilizing transposase RayT
MAKCQELKSEVIAIGGMQEHTHVLVRFHTTISVADLVKEMKGASSHLMTHKIIGKDEFFKWQGAYGAFTVSKRHVPHVTAYIVNQKKHHAENDLWDEFEKTVVTELPGE